MEIKKHLSTHITPTFSQSSLLKFRSKGAQTLLDDCTENRSKLPSIINARTT